MYLGDTKTTLVDEDLRSFAEQTTMFSGADMQILVRDAIMEPVRRCGRAKTFQRVTAPGRDGQPKEFWTPCSPGAPGAVEMSMMDVKGDELLEPAVTHGDFEAAKHRTK